MVDHNKIARDIAAGKQYGTNVPNSIVKWAFIVQGLPFVRAQIKLETKHTCELVSQVNTKYLQCKSKIE